MGYKMPRQHDVGEDVMAKWPKSSLWFKAKITDLNDIEYQVKFYDDSDTTSSYVLKYKDVKPIFAFDRKSRSKSRGRSPGRKSPARKKSPARATRSSRRSKGSPANDLKAVVNDAEIIDTRSSTPLIVTNEVRETTPAVEAEVPESTPLVIANEVRATTPIISNEGHAGSPLVVANEVRATTPIISNEGIAEVPVQQNDVRERSRTPFGDFQIIRGRTPLHHTNSSRSSTPLIPQQITTVQVEKIISEKVNNIQVEVTETVSETVTQSVEVIEKVTEEEVEEEEESDPEPEVIPEPRITRSKAKALSNPVASVSDDEGDDEPDTTPAASASIAKPSLVGRLIGGVKSLCCGVVCGVKSVCCGIVCGVKCVLTSIMNFILFLIPSLATIGTVPLVVMSLTMPFLINQMCTKKKCTIMEVPDIPKKLEYYYNPEAIGMALGFVALQLLLSLLPIGKVVELKNGAKIRCNGYIVLLLTLGVVPVLMHLGFNVLVVYTHYRHLLVTFVALAVLLSLVMYIRGGYAALDMRNPKGNTGKILPDFFHGRELTPALGSRIDLMHILFRIMCMGTILINVIFVIKDIQGNQGQYSPTQLVASIFQILFMVDYIWFEECLFTTFVYQHWGLGLMAINGLLADPFFISITTRFILNHRTEMEWYFLVGIAAVNLVGYSIMRGSVSQKHILRSNPNDPAVQNLESIPTAAGNRLLVSGWWGIVRHPNYLGELLIILSWTLICGIKYALPWVFFLLYLVSKYFLQIRPVEAFCQKKYGAAWDSYTSRVRSRLIPKVF
ncbi:unnamed protein product [Meganyctiphanes norvegica]|uniref:Lamin-B receptor n=1 Tax=Meganyctiphanes norvegica TaxID=48144 RepID=A0AAV2Q768_MEGNR